jgi:hypothetical protein
MPHPTHGEKERKKKIHKKKYMHITRHAKGISRKYSTVGKIRKPGNSMSGA